MSVCSVTKRDGEPCTLPAMQGYAWCWNHDPDRAEERSRNASRAASAKHSNLHSEMRGLRDILWQLIMAMLAGKLSFPARRDVTQIIQLLQIYLRAAEVELASGKEPERGSVLSPVMLQKLQQYVADKDREGVENQARRSEMMALARELTARRQMPEELAKVMAVTERVCG